MINGMKRMFLVCTLGLCLLRTASAANYSNPVVPGDHPDPSVIRVNRDYYATSTTSEWAPLFPILHSRDLVNWETIGAVFENRPKWAVGNFWAPEISQYKNKYYVYYVGRKKNGPLSVAVATAEKPEGPYKDHGPFISQDDGSIDPVPVVDPKGARWLIWKEDGNSRKMPTPLWIQRLSDEGDKLVGQKRELFHNDQPWEGEVVEGPFVLKHGNYYYLFYSGGGCCGRDCHYGLGVARAPDLFAAWEKNPKNPVLSDNATWRCPGHGSIVEDEKGADYLMYHSYSARDFVYVGRQALLDKIDWEADGWPSINQRKGPSASAPAPGGQPGMTQLSFRDEFDAKTLGAEWQWPQDIEPRFRVVKTDRGSLLLKSNESRGDDLLGSVLAIKTISGNYTAQAIISRDSLQLGTIAGFAAYGDTQNALGVALDGSDIKLWRRQGGKQEIILSRAIPDSDALHARVIATDGHKFRFSISSDGTTWHDVGDNLDLEGQYLPPWDRGIRIALTVGGAPDAEVRFLSFSMNATPPKNAP
jgi:xylan 1,4-beta-xylosidase